MRRDGDVLFSIIVPVYNVQNYLSDCVGSVTSQPGAPDWECLLIDDGSTDASGRMCDALDAEIPGVVALHQPNRGVTAARNAGLDAARGQWLLFLDSDDRMAPGLLESLRADLAAHPEEHWLVGRYLEYFEDTGKTGAPTHLDFVPGAFQSGDYAARVARLYDAARWSVWKYCLRRDWLAATGVRFREDMCWAEEAPLALSLLRCTDHLYFTDTVFVIYRSARAGSLLNDSRNLPRRFDSIAAGWAYLAASAPPEAELAEMRHRMADIFWPQARTAAVPDAAVRRACLPGLLRCRPLFAFGREVRTRRSWRVFQWLMNTFGPRFALWAGSRLK